MDQEDNPRFSHITVGQARQEGSSHADEEEVIAIGAVDQGTDSGEGILQAAWDDGDITTYAQDEKPDQEGEGDTENPSVKADGEGDLGEPMPLVQKMVIVGCGIGLVIATISLVLYWTM